MAPTLVTTPTVQQGTDAWQAFEILVARALRLRSRNGLWVAVDSLGHLVASNASPIQAVLAAEAALDAAEEVRLIGRIKAIRKYIEKGTVVLVPRVIDAGLETERVAWDVQRPPPNQATVLGSGFESWLEAGKAAMDAGW